jgi:putative effector of murein hydrolase
MSLAEWVRNPVFSIALTLLAYLPAIMLHRRWRWIPPIVAACLPIVAVLLLFHEPYAAYNEGGSYVTWLLGPATVALAVPMYRHGVTLRPSLPKLALIVLAGVGGGDGDGGRHGLAAGRAVAGRHVYRAQVGHHSDCH